ncbi:MAG TPA: VC0807 family protein [Candidatus Acidoferrum sp.]|jgi:hypothetical protein
MPAFGAQDNKKHRSKLYAALRGVAASMFVNVFCTYLVYRFLEARFRSGSVLPLAVSGLVPILGMTYGLLRQRAIDIIGFFAAEDIAVSLVASVFAHSSTSALVGRSFQNAVLGGVFLGSILMDRPFMLYVARQFVTGNDAAHRSRFDQIAMRPDAKRVYRIMTLVWAIVLFAKSAVTVILALSLTVTQYLVLSPVFTYGTDIFLVWWSVRYGYSKLGHYANQDIPTLEPEAVGTNANHEVQKDL